jgi:hypothetical protein
VGSAEFESHDHLKKISNIIGHGSHTKGRTHTKGRMFMGEIGKGKET